MVILIDFLPIINYKNTLNYLTICQFSGFTIKIVSDPLDT